MLGSLFASLGVKPWCSLFFEPIPLNPPILSIGIAMRDERKQC